MKVALLNESLDAVLEIKDVDEAWLTALRAANNPKAVRLRDLINVSKPSITENQRVEQNGWSIDVDGVRPVWVVIDEDQATIDSRAERAAVVAAMADLKTLRDSQGTLTGAQLSNASRALARAIIWLAKEGHGIS